MADTTTEIRQHRFDVGGMTCAACARRVERTLAKQPGVSQAGVNFALAKATVEATNEVALLDLIGAVEVAGYELAPERTQEESDHGHGIDVAHEDELTRAAWRRFLIAAALTIPLAIIGMALPMDYRLENSWIG